MYKNLLKFLVSTIILFSISTNTAKAYDFSAVNSDGQILYYNITSSTNHTVEVTYQYQETEGNYSLLTGILNIPSSVSYNGITYSVTTIGIHAFNRCRTITGVIIPNSVTVINNDAFWNCTNLLSVIIPNSISSLNANAVFTYCTRLTSIINMNTIPQAITTLGNSATFYDVPNNVNVYVPCSSLSAYQNSSWGNKFNNIKGFSSDTIISAHINIGNTYTLNGFNVDSTGLYINAIQNSFGCYDLKILNLHVDMNRILNVTICEGDCFTINGASYNQPGNYIIDSFTINNNICKTILNLSINSSINEVNNDNISVLVYPNPTNNKATLDIEGLNEKATLFIYDLQGREMMRKELNVGEKDIELNVKGFSKGVYNVRIVNNKDNITKKLIIQ